METIKDRTKRFALDIIKFSTILPRNSVSYIISKQLIRAATSVGANYRASQRARSRAEFISKLGIVEEEADESVYWLEIIIESGQVPEDKVKHLIKEANEITSIIVSSLKTAKSRLH